MLTNATVLATLTTTNIERAKEFYGKKLGLKPGRAPPMPGLAMYECGNGTRLFVYQRPTPPKAEHTQAHFEVADIVKTVKDLKAQGIKFEEYDFKTDSGHLKTVDGIATMEGSKSAWFKDPDGNIIGIVQNAK